VTSVRSFCAAVIEDARSSSNRASALSKSAIYGREVFVGGNEYLDGTCAATTVYTSNS